jgi:hypothetical protein
LRTWKGNCAPKGGNTPPCPVMFLLFCSFQHERYLLKEEEERNQCTLCTPWQEKERERKLLQRCVPSMPAEWRKHTSALHSVLNHLLLPSLTVSIYEGRKGCLNHAFHAMVGERVRKKIASEVLFLHCAPKKEIAHPREETHLHAPSCPSSSPLSNMKGTFGKRKERGTNTYLHTLTGERERKKIASEVCSLHACWMEETHLSTSFCP